MNRFFAREARSLGDRGRQPSAAAIACDRAARLARQGDLGGLISDPVLACPAKPPFPDQPLGPQLANTAPRRLARGSSA
jgi:hypothetical protein